jgi:two-component system, OmpR family, alkaline phosphatase synthesis response regulator PhoP
MLTKRILIVDDEPAITEALATLLRQAGYFVITARSGHDALAQLAAEPDLLVLDIMMPDLDGYAVCRAVREKSGYVPIIMLTAKDAPGDRAAGLELGADAYLTKPFEPGELLAQVRALFRLIEQQSAAPDGTAKGRLLWCGPLRLWESQHRVELNGQLVEVTPTEFELLRHLMQHPGHVFGRETLLREVWGYDTEVDSRTVDMHIQRLRAKIELDTAQPQLLRTIRGFGYCLMTPDE